MPNAFSSLIGIDIPIVEAAMSGATSPQLAAAVSNAGASANPVPAEEMDNPVLAEQVNVAGQVVWFGRRL